jgi:thymidine kinase
MGSLILTLGPMFSGKTTKSIQVYNHHNILNKSILVIKPLIDNRYDTNSIVTHDKLKRNCISVNKLSDILDINKYQVIIIDEGQFFSDIYEKALEWSVSKEVYVFGLNGDSNKNLFGDVYKLLPHVDEIIFLKSLCKICCDGTPAIFSKKMINNDKIVDVGGSDMYQAVCRKHF